MSAQEETPKATEVDPPTDAAEESLAEEVPADPESNLAETQSSDSYRSSYRPLGSIYGKYNSEDCCWDRGPRAPRLEVGDKCQPEEVR